MYIILKKTNKIVSSF